MNDPLNYLGSIWYPSEPSDVPYPPNQFLGWDFFDISYSKTALVNNPKGIHMYCFDLAPFLFSTS